MKWDSGNKKAPEGCRFVLVRQDDGLETNSAFLGAKRIKNAGERAGGSFVREWKVLSSAPDSENPNLYPVGEGFGFLVML